MPLDPLALCLVVLSDGPGFWLERIGSIVEASFDVAFRLLGIGKLVLALCSVWCLMKADRRPRYRRSGYHETCDSPASRGFCSVTVDETMLAVGL